MKSINIIVIASILMQIGYISSTPLPLYLCRSTGVNLSLVDLESGSLKPYLNYTQDFIMDYNNIYFINSSTIIGSGSILNSEYYAYQYLNVETNVEALYQFDFLAQFPLLNSFFNPNTNQIIIYNETILSLDPIEYQPNGINISLPSIIPYALVVGSVNSLLDSNNNILYFNVEVPPFPQMKKQYLNKDGEYACSFVIGCKYLISFDLQSGEIKSSVNMHFWTNVYTLALPISSTSVICLSINKNNEITFDNINPATGLMKTLKSSENQYEFIYSFTADTVNQIVYLFLSGDVVLSYNYQSNQINTVTLTNPGGTLIKVGSN
ncbi:hypothetical protein DLAC_10558 [Tieghemostelium lacteum]|uniref:Uncharacterized protein n=1 Tax=Tieghemostelium lacteum TaxID=361077 RepID=A0A151Z4X5_TIELA|nr:hypothetical protein DLAC_10558 [Tieghemostelium lacteum]|eukprot:KYQ88967.1 hypothetical protein DLAC_10558 [Tieghemostelium lacteum]